MPPVSLGAFRKHVADDKLQPLYVIVGEDEIGKTGAVDLLVDSVDEGLRAFNVDRLDASGATNASAREALVSQLLTAARTLPMMASRRVVIVQRADTLLFPKGKKDDEESAVPETPEPARRVKKAAPAEDPIEGYVEAPEQTTTLVFVTRSLPQNRRIGKMLAAHAAVVFLGTEISDADAIKWIDAQARSARVTFDPPAVRALIARTGGNVVALRSAVERVLLFAMGQTTIAAADVNEAVPMSPDSPENFGIANAIRRNDAATALRELDLALESGAAPFFVLGQLRSAAEELPASRLREAIEAVFRTDVALKSSGGDPRILLERLVVELATRGGAWRGFARR
jgi:DNA polymerase III delta subunit